MYSVKAMTFAIMRQTRLIKENTLDFLEFYSDKQKKSAYLLEGEDGYLHNLAINKIKKLYSVDEIDFTKLDSCDEIALISNLNVAPMLSETRVVCACEFYLEDKKNKLSDFLNGDLNSVLVISNFKKSPILEKLPIEVVECEKNEKFCKKFISSFFAKAGISANEECVNLICDYTSADMYKISTEIEKISAFCQKKGVVEICDVENLVNKDTDYKIYELTDYIANKKTDKAYKVLFDMLNKNEPLQRLFISIYNHFKRLFYCKLNGKNVDELVEILAIKEYAVKKTVALANKFPAKTLKEINDRFFLYDKSVKSGKLDIEEALWLSVFSVMVK